MWIDSIRRWADRPQDAITWTLGRLPRSQWSYVAADDEASVALGPGGLFCLHEAPGVPDVPGPETRRVHAHTRQVSDALLAATGHRVWPTAVGVVPAHSVDNPRVRFAVHYVSGDQLLRWLLTRPEVVDPATRGRWATALSRGRLSV